MPNSDDQNQKIIKEKLRQVKSASTRAANILKELEAYFKQFEQIRSQLDDEDNGLERNLEWSKSKISELNGILDDANELLSSLTKLDTEIRTLTDQIRNQHADVIPVIEQVNDPNNGIQAVLAAAKSYRDQIEALLESSNEVSGQVRDVLTAAQNTQAEIKTRYDDFLTQMKAVEDPETGLKAQLEIIKKYSSDALKAKTSAETDQKSISKTKDEVTEYFENITSLKDEMDAYKAESEQLTDDIRNTLGVIAFNSLSVELETQRKKLDRSLKFWGALILVILLALIVLLVFIFITLFIDKQSAIYVDNIKGSSAFFTILSKALFTSPLLFALYFATSNYSRARDFRDRYVVKEISSKNLQAYVKLLRDEFPSNEQERLDFAVHNMQAIYNDPVPNKKRSYNFGINKIFQFGVHEEDARVFKDTLVRGAEEILDDEKTAGAVSK
jgi:ABC-type transporter Mla subunit MlaD